MSESLPPQTVKPVGTEAPEAQAVQGVTGGVPVAISGSFSVSASSTAHATAAAPSYTEGTDVPFSSDLAGNLRTLATLSGASSFSDGSVDRQARVQDTDTGAGTHYTAEALLVTPGAGGPVQTGTSGNPLRVDPTGATTQPISGTVTANAGSGTFVVGDGGGSVTVDGTVAVSNFPGTQPVSGTVTANQGTSPWVVDGSAVTQPVSGTFFQATQPVSGTVTANQGGTWTVQPGNTANTTAWKVDGSAVTQPVSGTFFQATQPVSGTVTANQGGTWTVQPGNTANTTAWKVDGSAVTQPVSGTVTANQGGTWTVQPGNTANTTAWKVDGSAVTQPVSIAATVTVAGAKTNNNAAPGATNVGNIGVLANAGLPAWTEGNLVTESADLSGATRTTTRPPVVTGAYRIQVTTASYTALGAGANLISFRFGAAALCVVTRVRVFVTTSTAAAAAGRIDRALFIVRSFTVADSAGTAVTLTSPVGKLRTSHAATGVANLMASSGAALTNGTGTQDANPVGVMAVAGTATEGIGLTLPRTGCDADLFAYSAGQNYPIVLAQNEGLRITIPTAMPTTIAQITSATFEWYEVATANF